MARRREVGRRYLQGETQNEIAAAFRINQSQISRDLKWLRGKWLESALIDVNEAKARELAKIDALEREYWEAWQRSCEDAEATVKKTKGVVQRRQEEDGTFVAERPAEVQQTSKGQAGDPRFLAGIQWCIDRRCKILGIDAPTKMRHEGTGKDGAIKIDDARAEEHARSLATLADALGGLVAAGRPAEPGAVDAAEQTAVGSGAESGG
jgi:hypothetical protein